TCRSPTPTRACSTAVVLSRESRSRTAAPSRSRRTPMRTSRPAHGRRPHTRRWLGSTLVALALAVLAAAPAAAQATVAQVAEQLGQSPVYVDPDAEAKIDAAQVRDRVLGAGTPIYVAVL